MINTPAVTVLMPVPNATSTLEACLDSVQAQNLSDFELLVVDDGSTDGSADVVAELEAMGYERGWDYLMVG